MHIFVDFTPELLTSYPVTPKMTRASFNEPDAIAPVEPTLQCGNAPPINAAPFLWLLLLFVAALLIGGVAFFFGVLKGKEIEARLQKRSQKLTRLHPRRRLMLLDLKTMAAATQWTFV
jgi:hypothetical protein